MKTSIQLFSIITFLISYVSALAQNDYSFSTSQGTFSPLSNGTQCFINTDDAVSSSKPIGFNFNYLGTNYSSFIASSNGWLTFDTGVTTNINSNKLDGAPLSTVIAPLWDDLSGSNGQASFSTSGTSPNRIFTFEWLNWSWSYTSVTASISFQVKLYETSNKIEFIYRQESGALESPSASIGISSTNKFLSLTNSTSSTVADLFIENSEIDQKPVTGQIFRFTSEGVLAPTIQAKNIYILSGLTTTSMNLHWTKGNGAGRAVFVKQTSSMQPFIPFDGVKYIDSSLFGNSVYGDNWSCVYNGIGDKIKIGGLTPGLSYVVQVFEWSGGFARKYSTSGAINNPILVSTSSTTLSLPYLLSVNQTNFTPIQNGTGVPEIQDDDAISNVIPIGFLFNFDEFEYSQIIASSNGFFYFNTDIRDNVYLNELENCKMGPAITPFWDDLHGLDGTASYQTTGSSPNRIFTFQWLNWSCDFSATTPSISFQVKLYETTNKIEFIYRQEAGSLVSPSASIGLMGHFPNEFLSLDGPSSSPIASHSLATNSISATPATDQVYVFTPANSTQTITFGQLPTKTYGDNSFQLTATASSGMSVLFSSSDPNIVIDGNLVTIIGAGTATITASQPGDLNFKSANQAQQLTVNKATLTVTAVNASRVYGDANPTFTYSYSGFKNNESSSVIDTPPTVSTTAVVTSNAGSYSITPVNGTDNNYDFSYVNGALTVNKATLTITAVNTSRAYGDQNPIFTYSYSGFKNNQSSSVIDTPPTVSSTAVTTSNAGSYSITPMNGTDNNYDFSYVDGTLTVTKAPLTATAANVSRPYGDPNPPFTINYAGFKNGDTSGVLDVVPSLTCDATQESNPGIYTITISGGADANYNFIRYDGSLIIDKLNQTISFPAISDRQFDEPPFEISASGGNSGNRIVFTSENLNIVKVDGNKVTITGTGRTNIRATQAGNIYYNAGLSIQSIFVDKAFQSISFTPIPKLSCGDPPFTLVAVGGKSNNPVTFTTVFTNVAEVQGNTLLIKSAGEVHVIASQSGNENYHGAGEDQIITIGLGSPTIQFDLGFTEIFDSSPDVTLSAISSTGSPVNFFGTSGPIRIENGNQLQFMLNETGPASVTAYQIGDGCWDKVSVTRTFTVVRDPILSISESHADGVNIYPIPSHGKITIDAGQLKIRSYQILNSAGEILLSSDADEKSLVELNVEQLPSGPAVLLVRTSAGDVTKKIVFK